MKRNIFTAIKLIRDMFRCIKRIDMFDYNKSNGEWIEK